MNFHRKYYLVEGGPLLALAKEYHDDLAAFYKELNEFIVEIGANGYRFDITGQLNGLRFEGDVPEGYKKPDKHGATLPYKKNKEAWAQLKKFKQPKAHDYIDRLLKIPCGLAYRKGDEISGSTMIGHPFEPYGFYWYDPNGPVLMTVPDVAKYASDIMKESDEYTFDDDLHLWKLEDHADGVRPILKEEWDFMRAKYEQEKQT